MESAVPDELRQAWALLLLGCEAADAGSDSLSTLAPSSIFAFHINTSEVRNNQLRTTPLPAHTKLNVLVHT